MPTPAIEANVPPIAAGEPKPGEGVVTLSAAPETDHEARVAALEAEKARLIEERENYKNAYLKEKGKKSPDTTGEETEDEKMRRIAQEVQANSRIAEIAREQDAIIKKALKENKELKLAQMNKTGVPGAVGSHTEQPQAPTDTLITPEQIAHLKQTRGWTDKDI